MLHRIAFTDIVVEVTKLGMVSTMLRALADEYDKRVEAGTHREITLATPLEVDQGDNITKTCKAAMVLSEEGRDLAVNPVNDQKTGAELDAALAPKLTVIEGGLEP